ncbi:MAG: tRNA lysidine(34) synthetase TilS, partial [Bifidobacterium crudilactis]|nr:tRNA lysidine(34) synthetase TilS [Bifidobacterium crudilactis]
MAYSSILKHMLGEVRACLEAEGITRQSRKFLEHGHHPAGQDSPLVMVACSGGRDSIALASLAHTVCGMLGVRCGAVVIDHGLFEASAALTRTVVERCHGMGLSPVVDRRIQVLPGGKGVEAAAREARYSAICDTAGKEQAALVLLAHTADDQAE